jgi:AraC-like DNA-binding protein
MQHAGFANTALPGDLILFSMDETWLVDWEDVEWISLCIPRDIDSRLSAGLSALPPGHLRGAGASLLADLLIALPARAAAAGADELPSLAGAVQCAVVACLLAGGDGSGHRLTTVAATLARERVRRVILRNIGSAQLNPSKISVAAGISRSALYRIFEGDGGVARYIRQVRLSLANVALRDPNLAHQSIKSIAEAHGFPEPSDFSRAFRAAYGVAPRDVRGIEPSGPAFLPPDQWPQPRRSRPGYDLATLVYATTPASPADLGEWPRAATERTLRSAPTFR